MALPSEEVRNSAVSLYAGVLFDDDDPAASPLESSYEVVCTSCLLIASIDRRTRVRGVDSAMVDYNVKYSVPRTGIYAVNGMVRASNESRGKGRLSVRPTVKAHSGTRSDKAL